MSAGEEVLGNYVSRIFAQRERIAAKEKMVKSYEEQRKDFPKWVTKNGKEIQVADIENQHLCNLIEFIRKKDPESEWLKVFRAETRNREFAAELKAMKKELEEMEEILHLYL